MSLVRQNEFDVQVKRNSVRLLEAYLQSLRACDYGPLHNTTWSLVRQRTELGFKLDAICKVVEFLDEIVKTPAPAEVKQTIALLVQVTVSESFVKSIHAQQTDMGPPEAWVCMILAGSISLGRSGLHSRMRLPQKQLSRGSMG